MSEIRVTLKEFANSLLLRFSEDGKPITQDKLADILDISATTAGKWFRGIPSARETIRGMCDHAGISRCEFLWASGLVPEEEDFEKDKRAGFEKEQAHIRSLAGNYGQLIEYDRRHRVQTLDAYLAAIDGTEDELEEEPVDLFTLYPGERILMPDRDIPNPELSIRKGDSVVLSSTEEPMEQQFGALLFFLVDGEPRCNRLMAIQSETYQFMPLGNGEDPRIFEKEQVKLIGRVSCILHRC